MIYLEDCKTITKLVMQQVCKICNGCFITDHDGLLLRTCACNNPVVNKGYAVFLNKWASEAERKCSIAYQVREHQRELQKQIEEDRFLID